MDLGIEPITGIVASGTTDYLVQFKGIFLLVGGIVLAFVILTMLVAIVRGEKDIVE